jgi:hypothetical protein
LGVVAAARVGLGEEIEQLADRSLPEQGLGQGPIALDPVAVASALLALST